MINQLMRSIAAVIAGAVVTGCATVNPMAFDKQTKAIDTKDKSIVLMTVDVSRSDGSRYVPEPFVVKLEKPGAQTKEDRQNFKFSKDTDAMQENGHDLYLVRLALVAGDYKVVNVTGKASAVPINSLFEVPLLSDLKVKPNSVTYVGRVTAKLRDRVGNEFRAGPVVPLIDQAITGMSGGTWDVSVENAAARDIGLFRAAYPALKDVAIDTAPLPAFDRQAVQRWWDGEVKTAEPHTPPAQVAAK
ncbi:MAG: hypothetical protein WCC39_14235 [Telluria sp.]